MSDNKTVPADKVIDFIDEMKADDMMKFIEVLEQGLKESDKDADPLGRSDHWQKSIPKMDANEAETVAWLEENIVPVSWEAMDTRDRLMHSTGPIYRAGVMLEGGFFIPCVAFANPYHFNRAARMLKEDTPMSKWDVEMVRSHLTHPRNEITVHTIKRVLPSPYILSKEYFEIVQKGGELRGGERYFVGTMNDGTRWQFLSIASPPLFINMPSGYSTGSIIRVEAVAHLNEPHLNIWEDQEKGFYGVYGYAGEIFREMPCFWCFTDQIKVGDEVLKGWKPED